MKLGGSARAALVLGLVSLGLCACSPLPYPTKPPRAVERDLKQQNTQDQVPKSRAIALCYSDRINTPKDLMDEARLLCDSGSLKYVGTDILWTSCSLLQPARATFLCFRNSATPSPQ